MSVDLSPVLACAARWRPRPGWATTVKPAYDTLVAGATGLVASHAWSELAMMMGDTRAAPLALVVCLHAERALGSELEDRRLGAHRDLCFLDLGLAHAHADGPIRIAALGEPGTVVANPSTVEAWLVRALAPFDGELERAAWYALGIAAHRTGVITGDEPQP